MTTRQAVKLVLIVVLVAAILGTFSCTVETVPAGHVSVPTMFGKVRDTPYKEGFHFVNPFLAWTVFDARQKTHYEQVTVPSQDQLTTHLDLSVQYRVIGDLAPSILQDTGNAEMAVQVHLVPKLRSIVREQGKTIQKAEDFFQETTQVQLQAALTTGLQEYLNQKGLKVEAVLIRDVQLPSFIVKAIESKKEREQEAEKQIAELARFKTEQEQKIAQSEAEKRAAENKAEEVKTLADATAYEIQKVNEAIADSPGYIQLQALKTLAEMSKDPSAKFYFIDGKNGPVPLLHLEPNQNSLRNIPAVKTQE